jgi:hypothetical protein
MLAKLGRCVDGEARQTNEGPSVNVLCLTTVYYASQARPLCRQDKAFWVPRLNTVTNEGYKPSLGKNNKRLAGQKCIGLYRTYLLV